MSTHLFWQRALQESSRRALFQRLRHVLSLLLHLLIFALLVAALARPSFERALPSGASTVIVLDARARMQATEPDGQTRFTKALALARTEARLASQQQQTALLVLEAQPYVAAPFASDEKPLLDALGKATPTDATGDLSSALWLADALLGSRAGEKRIIVLSDRPTPESSPHLAPLTTRVVGSPRDNVAITRLATRPVPSSPETSQVLLEIQNFSAAPVSSEVELSFDGRPLEVKPFSLAPGERRQEIFASVPHPTRNARGWLIARLSAPDALPLDNVAYALLPPIRPARVLLVSAGNPFLESFLSVDTTVKYQVVAPDVWQPSLASKFEAVIFDGALPPGFDLANAAGNYLFLKASPFLSTSALDQPLVTEVDAVHPTTRNVSLQNVSILHAAALTVPPARDGWTFRAPLRSFDHALLITGERKNQRLAALAFDVLESDLPLRVAFPLLMSNTLHWLAGEQPDATPYVTTGETITLAENERLAPEPFTVPPAKPPAATITRTFQPRSNGYYFIMAGETAHWLAANTFTAAESDLRGSAGGPPVKLSEEGSPVLHALPTWPPWQWLTIAALVLFTMEWWLFHRRKTE